MKGTVYLVGAGPGDPGLLTLRGAEALSRADVVVHDRLTGQDILSLAPASAERVDVGKQPDDRGDQEAINQLLVARAEAGLVVVRLKGGDPFVFGRGGEEALALQAAGVPFEVVPGVTSATAVPACAGVPVTHRGLVTSFTVVAGHSRSVDASPEMGGTNWEALAAAGGTIVVLMGAAHRARIAERLMGGGLHPTTPVVAVRWGAGPRQEKVRTTLRELPSAVLSPPVTIVIGQVAGLDLTCRLAQAGWSLPEGLPGRLGDPGPLVARTVVVTRAEHQAPVLSSRLRALGARVLEVPAIALAPAADGGAALAAAVARLGTGAFSWVVLSSPNAAERFFSLVPDARALCHTKLAALGPATAEAVERFRVVPDLVPEDYRAEGLLACFPRPGPASSRLLLPQAAGARPALREGLEAAGWEVTAVEAYRTVQRTIGAGTLAAAARADAICFASPSAVRSYLDQARGVLAGGAPPGGAPPGVPPVVVCIGPATAGQARSAGLVVTAEASEHSVDGLVEALVAAMPASPL